MSPFQLTPAHSEEFLKSESFWLEALDTKTKTLPLGKVKYAYLHVIKFGIYFGQEVQSLLEARSWDLNELYIFERYKLKVFV